MSGTGSVEHADESAGRLEEVRRGVEQAEAGDVAGADRVERLHETDPAGVEAAEQEASDGPEGRGLSR